MPHGHGQKLRGLSKAIHQHTCATGECGDCESYVKRQPSKQLDLTHLQAAQPSLMLLQASDQNKKNRDLCYGFPVASKRQVDDFPVHFPSATGSSITGGWDFVLLTGRKKAQWFLSEWEGLSPTQSCLHGWQLRARRAKRELGVRRWLSLGGKKLLWMCAATPMF